MPYFLGTSIDLDRLCRLTELAGLAALERLHTGAYDDPPSTLNPGRDVKVVGLTEALAPALPGSTAEFALLLLDETAEGPLVERLVVEGEGWHGYACVVPPSTYLAVCFTAGRSR